MKTWIKINDADNTAVLLKDFKKGEKIGVDEVIVALEDIHYGHKIALCDIPNGGAVLKYAEVIGHATQDIQKGMWVHTHNCE